MIKNYIFIISNLEYNENLLSNNIDIIINNDNFFKELYPNEKNYDFQKHILQQLLVDFNREIIIINKNKVNSVYDFYKIISTNFTESLFYKISLCCQQTIFSIPCQILYDLYPNWIVVHDASPVQINIDLDKKIIEIEKDLLFYSNDFSTKKKIRVNINTYLDSIKNDVNININIYN